ncbi:hypothetical protein MNBD_BACTEROID03-651 [hydrothermal vent metagenome]|uniref:HipA N-terminal subdomain 1 domain-containing protein n=1 Tax=hydrothermal vent metagenome TaxID=652676 RepID=A0A3B0T810_9ZZZZ
MRRANIFYKEFLAGVLTETDDGEYIFAYVDDYIGNHQEQFITFTMPVTKEPYVSDQATINRYY